MCFLKFGSCSDTTFTSWVSEKVLEPLPYTAGVVDLIGDVLQREPLSSFLSLQKHTGAAIG